MQTNALLAALNSGERNFNYRQLADAIEEEIGLVGQLVDRRPYLMGVEWFGLCPSFRFVEPGTPKASDNLPVRSEMLCDWKPGTNEGYVVSVCVVDYTVTPMTLKRAWTAKTADAASAAAIHLKLVNLLNGNGSSMEGMVNRLVAAAVNPD